MAELFSGLGLVWMARWFWWRINAWGEITAYILSIVGCATINILEMYDIVFPEWQRYVMICIFSVIGWITVTLLTQPVSEEKLKKFVMKVNPGGPLWRRITRQVDQANLPAGPSLAFNILSLVLGAFGLFMIVFGIGSFLVKSTARGFLMIGTALILGSIIYRLELFRHQAEKNGR
jgi:hypothetical protein